MKTIIDDIALLIQEWAEDQVSTLIVKNFGFVELVNRESRGKKSVSAQPIPITIPGDGSEGEQVSLDDQFNFIFWIRTNGRTAITVDENDKWGLDPGRRLNTPLRIVIAHRNNLGENLVYDLFQDLPESIIVEGFEFVFLDASGDIDDDHETIYNTELGKTNYEKHRFTWNIYALNVNIQYVICVDYVPIPVVDPPIDPPDPPVVEILWGDTEVLMGDEIITFAD